MKEHDTWFLIGTSLGGLVGFAIGFTAAFYFASKFYVV